MPDFIYSLTENFEEYQKWKEAYKLVDRNWLETNGVTAQAETEGIELYWSRPEKIKSRISDGYDIFYEVNESKRTRYRLVDKEGFVLLGKKTGNGTETQ